MVDWERVIDAVTTSLTGDRERGRALLIDCWSATAPADHAQRCVLAHYLADTEVELDAEVAWDERAIQEFASTLDDDLAPIGIPSARGMAPSLHLNLGDGYLRQARVVDARAQLDLALAAVDALTEDGYSRMIRNGLDALQARIDSADASLID